MKKKHFEKNPQEGGGSVPQCRNRQEEVLLTNCPGKKTTLETGAKVRTGLLANPAYHKKTAMRVLTNAKKVKKRKEENNTQARRKGRKM